MVCVVPLASAQVPLFAARSLIHVQASACSALCEFAVTLRPITVEFLDCLHDYPIAYGKHTHSVYSTCRRAEQGDGLRLLVQDAAELLSPRGLPHNDAGGFLSPRSLSAGASPMSSPRADMTQSAVQITTIACEVGSHRHGSIRSLIMCVRNTHTHAAHTRTCTRDLGSHSYESLRSFCVCLPRMHTQLTLAQAPVSQAHTHMCPFTRLF